VDTLRSTKSVAAGLHTEQGGIWVTTQMKMILFSSSSSARQLTLFPAGLQGAAHLLA